MTSITVTGSQKRVSPPTRREGNRHDLSGRPFEVVLSFDATTLRLDLRGELDVAAAPIVERTVRLGESAGLRVVIDCCDVTFIDAAGVRALLWSHRDCDAALTQVNGQVRRVFAMLHLDHIVSDPATNNGRLPRPLQ